MSNKEKHLNNEFEQEKVNKVWQEVWASSAVSGDMFKNQLFIEAWKVFGKYIPKDAKTVLEAGGGSGRYGLKIAQDLPNSKVIVVDIVDSSLSLIKKLAEEMKLENIYVGKDDVLKLSFPDNYFDLVISDAVIQHVADDGRAIGEMVRVLKPGGVLIVSAVGRWNFHSLYKAWLKLVGRQYEYKSERAYTKKELRNLLEGKGLEIITEDGFYPAYGILRLKKRHKIFKLLGRICNRLTKILDRFTNRFFSRNFGFEIVVVGRK
ncbi:class I SAM-dependent methyltransferase [Candidatus Falkowbacteria bacterium]|nr:class I SAM-dependent methyltransferase [Candidatus Falkowbacteria bacterium]